MQAALRMGRRGEPGNGAVAPPSAGGLQTNRMGVPSAWPTKRSGKGSLFFFFLIYLFGCTGLVAAVGSCCHMGDLQLQPVGSSSWSRDQA